MASCVYSRLTALLVNGTIPEPVKQKEVDTGMLYMRMALKRNASRFEDLKVNLDEEMNKVAKAWMKTDFSEDWVVVPDEDEIAQ